MKLKTNLFRLLAIILLFGTISSCGVTKVKIEKGQVLHSLISPLNDQDSSSVTINYQYYSDFTVSYQDSVNRRVIQYASSLFNYGHETPTSELNRTFFEECSKAFERECLSYQSEDFFMLWFADFDVVIDEKDKYVTLSISDYTFMGGAHPNGFISYFTFDKENGARLLKEDFISNIEEITAMAEPIFREAHELGPEDDLEEAGYWFENNKFRLNQNFYFDDTDMIFYFNNYEITAYAAGPSEIRIPINRIKHLFLRGH
jgi:hypothetical protein